MEATVEFMIRGWALFAGLCLAVWVWMLWEDFLHRLQVGNIEWIAKCRKHEAKAKAKAKAMSDTADLGIFSGHCKL